MPALLNDSDAVECVAIGSGLDNRGHTKLIDLVGTLRLHVAVAAFCAPEVVVVRVWIRSVGMGHLSAERFLEAHRRLLRQDDRVPYLQSATRSERMGLDVHTTRTHTLDAHAIYCGREESCAQALLPCATPDCKCARRQHSVTVRGSRRHLQRFQGTPTRGETAPEGPRRSLPRHWHRPAGAASPKPPIRPALACRDLNRGIRAQHGANAARAGRPAARTCTAEMLHCTCCGQFRWSLQTHLKLFLFCPTFLRLEVSV